MALLKVYTYPDPVLKKIAEPVTDFGPEMQKFFDDMIETMFVEDGVGLAAPQVGVSKRVLISSPTMKRGEEYVIVNPKISEKEGSEVDLEGCLSLPGISGKVARAKRVRLKYQDRHGESHDVHIKDFFARIIQHEADHLDGVLFIERMDFDKRQEALAEYNSINGLKSS